jgi:hypothetical protein
MPVIQFLGQKLYIQMKPTFIGAKAPVLKKVPYTADNPTLPQRKARYWLASTAHGLQGTFGRLPKMPVIAAEIQKKKPGKGVHGGLKTLRDYAIKRRVTDARIEELRVAAGA